MWCTRPHASFGICWGSAEGTGDASKTFPWWFDVQKVH